MIGIGVGLNSISTGTLDLIKQNLTIYSLRDLQLIVWN